MRPSPSGSSQRGQGGLGRQAAVLAFGSLFAQGASLLSLIVLTRLVAKPSLGGYQQLWLVYGILSPFLVGGVPAGLFYFIPRARTKEEIRKVVLDAYVVLGALGVASSLGVFLLREPIAAAMNNTGLAASLAAYAPYPFFAFITAAMPGALVATGRARLAAGLNALNGLATVGIVIAAAAISPTTRSMAAGLSVSAAVIAMVSTAGVFRALRIGSSLTWRSVAWRPLVSYGLPLALTQLAGRLGFQIDRLVVSTMFTPSQFAVYALGAVEVPIAVVVQQAVNNVLVPALSKLYVEGDLVGVAQLWHAAIRKTSLIMLPLFAFLMVMADSVIRVLYGSNFAGSISIFRAYLFLVPLRVATYGLITQAIGRTGINLSAALVLVATNGMLAVALVFPLGTLGPAIATPLATALTAAYYLMRLRGIVSLPLGRLLPWRLLSANLVVSFGAAAPLLLLFTVSISPFVRLALACLVFPVLCLGVLRATGRITQTEWVLLRAMLPIRRRRVVTAP